MSDLQLELFPTEDMRPSDERFVATLGQMKLVEEENEFFLKSFRAMNSPVLGRIAKIIHSILEERNLV